MSSIQRVIKYCAMGFAVVLMVGILTGITAVVSGIDKGINWSGKQNYIDFTKEFEDINNLDLTNYSGKMLIQVGAVNKVIVKATKVPDTMIVDVKSNNTLYIDDKDSKVWFIDFHLFGDEEEEESQITIIVPIDFVAKTAQIDNNSGRLEMNDLYADYLEISGGSGYMTGANLNAKEFDISVGSGDLELNNVALYNGEIDGGSGAIHFTDSTLKDVDLKIGSGSMQFEGSMTGKNKIDGGSGSTTLNLSDFVDYYNLKLESGSGGIWINDEKVKKDNISNTNAENTLEVDGGSGKVSITFQQMQ